MAREDYDLLIIGGGINGAAVARDASGRGLSVFLAERGDYASATSSASSKLIHGGLRYLENHDISLVRESLKERDILLRIAPHLVQPLRFLLPAYKDHGRPPWLLRLGLFVYDLLAGSRRIERSGALGADEIRELPGLARAGLRTVLYYFDCQTDDSRLVMANLLDARARGADIANRREVVAIAPNARGYSVEVREPGGYRTIQARFVVNTAGPWANKVLDLCAADLPRHKLRLVRGSHIVLRSPDPAGEDAYLLQNSDGRVVFVIPWLRHFLMIGTTDVAHTGDPASARCSPAERAYLLDAYNNHFSHPGGPAQSRDVVWSFAGVRALFDDGSDNPSKVTRDARILWRRQGSGGFVTVYGGKLTTHRRLAEKVLRALAMMGARTGRRWTHKAPLAGGTMGRRELAALARGGPQVLHGAVRRRWVATYGDAAAALFQTVRDAPEKAREIAPRIHLAELEHAVAKEDVRTAEDFLYRRTKLFLSLDAKSRRAVADWFNERAGLGAGSHIHAHSGTNGTNGGGPPAGGLADETAALAPSRRGNGPPSAS
ncbi:MAG: glycerol-3-phosphate dehydrogenase [Rhodobiaceae bacterium]|nr:glycerol-3-phosphate dehydrogenase [Rhodobiaceae bacterium]